MAHGLEQSRRALSLACDRGHGQQAFKQGLRLIGNLAEPLPEDCLGIHFVQRQISFSATIPRPIRSIC